MKWAIICNDSQMLAYWKWDVEQERFVWTEEEVPANTVVNLIEYDGESPYTPPDGTRLEQVEDDANIGDLIE